MAALWPLSRIPQIDPNGDPYDGALAYFYNEETTTPQTIYQDSGLSVPHANPVEANANGAFPAVYLNPTPGSYRQRVTDASGNVLFDDDGISVPQAADFVPPDAGSTDTTLLFSTGMLQAWYATGVKSGWVRANGRTIGSAASGATERANADTSALFQFLWTADANLSVSGGRGGTAAGDFSANKTIALPDLRDRVLVGLGDMGNSDANRIADALVDSSSTNTTLGATAGASTHTLTQAELPAVAPTFSGSALASISFTLPIDGVAHGAGGLNPLGKFYTSNGDQVIADDGSITQDTNAKSPGTPAGTISNLGSGNAHTSLQPGMFSTIYIKL